jgi:hypothetical protein
MLASTWPSMTAVVDLPTPPLIAITAMRQQPSSGAVTRMSSSCSRCST